MSTREWQPLLVGDAAREARAIVDDIASALIAREPSDLPGLKGDLSTALLLAECDSPAAAQVLERALVTATSSPLTLSLFSGVSGCTWVLQHIADGPDVAALVEHFDGALARHLDVATWHDRIDLMSGIAGAAVMLADRSDVRARALAARLITHLESLAIESTAGATWRIEPRFLPPPLLERFPNGMIDVGVAHGMPGIIGGLAQLAEAGIETERSQRLLRRAISWLFATIPNDCPRFGTGWPDIDGGKRIGWCYGDLGIAAVTLLASRALDDASLATIAIDLLHKISAPFAIHGVPDAGFCHGAAGAAHIFNVAFQHTHDSVFREQALHWLREMIRLRAPGTGIAGYASLDISGSTPRWKDDATLLSGVVGIALVLLAAMGDREPTWQRLFAM